MLKILTLPRSLIPVIILVLFLSIGCFSDRPARAQLASYVSEQDDVYDWQLEEMVPRGDGSVLFMIRLTSQQWQGYTFKHRLILIIPEKIEVANLVGLFVGGGSLADEAEVVFDPGADEIELLSEVANEIRSPMAVLFDVPYQPLFDGLKEDALISYTFDRFLETNDSEWPLLFPMTASVVRAMDCLEEIASTFYGLEETEFLVGGGSKRGWTTWLTAAVDSRVAGIAPAVYDNLGLKRQMNHQLEVWGSYSPQISDYTERGLQEELETEAGQRLVELVDPYNYLEDIVVPKLIIAGTNDPYWPLDALHLYYDDLRGPINLLYLPNVGHGLGDWEKVLTTYGVFHHQTARGQTLPNVEDSLRREGDQRFLRVYSGFLPAGEIRLWRAESPSRDFREAQWEVVDRKEGTGTAEFCLDKSEDLWVGVFAEVIYSDPLEFSLTTRVHVLS